MVVVFFAQANLLLSTYVAIIELNTYTLCINAHHLKIEFRLGIEWAARATVCLNDCCLEMEWSGN